MASAGLLNPPGLPSQHQRTYSTFSSRSASSRDSIARPATNIKPVRRTSDETPLLSHHQSLKHTLRPTRRDSVADLEANAGSESWRQAVDWEKWFFLAIIAALYLTCLGLLYKTQRKYYEDHGCYWNCDKSGKE